MNKRLFVGSLPFEYSDEQLAALFAPLGPVIYAKMVWDKKHNRSRGFGFVELPSDEACRQAIEQLNGTMVEEKKIWVTPATPRKEKAPAARPYAGGSPALSPDAPPRTRRPFREGGRKPPRFAPGEDPNRLFPGVASSPAGRRFGGPRRGPRPFGRPGQKPGGGRPSFGRPGQRPERGPRAFGRPDQRSGRGPRPFGRPDQRPGRSRFGGGARRPGRRPPPTPRP